MPWDAPHRRAAGLALEIVRVRWIYGILAVLTEYAHLHPAEIITLLEAVNRRNTPIIGDRDISRDRIARRIISLHREGLLARCNGHAGPGAHTAYDLTRLGAGLIAAFAPLGTWGVGHYDHLVRTSRIRHDLDPDAPIPARPDPADTCTRHLAARLAVGALDSRWAFTVLAHCAHGPVRPGVLQLRINRALASHPDLTGRRYLGAKAEYETLAWLIRAGLLHREMHARLSSPTRALYRTTPLGAGLLGALAPVAQWGLGHDGELYRIVASRAGWAGGDD